MQLHQLEQFCAVAQAEHMSQAAKALHISQPTLSLNITRLEDELGVRLFDRVGRNIKLNQYGHAFLFHVEQALNELAAARQAVMQLDQKGSNKISIADAIRNNTYAILSAYMAVKPSVELMHQTATVPEIISLLRDERIDLAIAAASSKATFDMDIRWVPACHTRLMILVPEDHRFAKREKISLHELAGEPLMGPIPNFDVRDCFDHYCEQSGFVPNYVYTSIKPFLFNQLTRERGYIALIAEALWTGNSLNADAQSAKETSPYMDISGIVGVQIEDPVCTVDYGILTSKKHHLSGEKEDFLAFVQSFLQTRMAEL